MKDELFIVILNWNGWHDTIFCIESINLGSCNIVLVDNGSINEEVLEIQKYLREKFPNYIELTGPEVSQQIIDSNHDSLNNNGFYFIKNDENLGFAGGNNVGLDLVNRIGGRYALLLNNDTVVYDNSIEKLFRLLKSDIHIGAVIPQIRYFNPSDVIWNCGGKINFLGIRKYYYAFKNIDETPQKGTKVVDYGTGCCLMFDLDKVGKLSEKFFFGEEDMEFAFRVKKLGLKIICDFESIIYHKVGSSRDLISKNSVGKMTYHYSQRISNLADNLPKSAWMLSVGLHMLSSIRLLIRMKKFNLRTFSRIWKEVLKNTNKEKFLREDFISISNKNY